MASSHQPNGSSLFSSYNIHVFSHGLEEHISNACVKLPPVPKTEATPKRKKCKFSTNITDFLGHFIGPWKIPYHIRQHRWNASRGLETLSNVIECVLTGFIQCISSLCLGLYRIPVTLKPGTQETQMADYIKWIRKGTEALDKLKDKLISSQAWEFGLNKGR